MKFRFSISLILLPLILVLSSCTMNANTSAPATTQTVQGANPSPTQTIQGANPSAAQTIQVITPASTPEPTLEQLLGDALNFLNQGKYEEAIQTYSQAITMEPKNFAALFGLGQAYHAVKQPDKAVAALKLANEVKPDDLDAALELGRALLDVESYADAEALLLPMTGETNFQPQAGAVLALVYLKQKKTEAALALLKHSGMDLSEKTYIGPYDTDGKRDGFGYAFYIVSGRTYLYWGYFKNDIRSGHGAWIDLFDDYRFEGEWADDAPNGYGEESFPNVKRSGNFLSGLQDGNITAIINGNTWNYTAKQGKPNLIAHEGKEYEIYNGKKQFYVAELPSDPHHVLVWQEGEIWGVSGFTAGVD